MNRAQLAKIIKKQIPLTRAMGLEVAACSATRGVKLKFPLKPNRNHKNTAFGGTLVAGQALASWAWIMSLLDSEDLRAHVVVQRQNSEFLSPVASDFLVSADPPAPEAIQAFLRTLRRRGKARIEISASVSARAAGGSRRHQLASKYVGEYVAVLE
jgi:thioesterase domain-containing protein